MAAGFETRARAIWGDSAIEAVKAAERVLMLYLTELYARSSDSPGRQTPTDPVVVQRVMTSYAESKQIASPLFLATRYLIRELYSKVDLPDPALELGLGAGDTASAILGKRKLAVGSTPIIDEVMSAKHNYRNHRLYLAAEASQIPFADESFNTVVMNYTFYHLEDPAAACREAFRVLAPDGTLHFNLALRDALQATRMLPRALQVLGLRDFASMAEGFVFPDYGATDSSSQKREPWACCKKSAFPSSRSSITSLSRSRASSG